MPDFTTFPAPSMRHLALGLVLAAAALLAAPAHAQYFGRNQVRYDQFDYRVLETEHFDIYYYEGMDQAVRDVARMAERWYDRLSVILQHEYDERKSIILYADDADFRQTNITRIGEGTQGVTEGLRQRVVLPVAGTYAETDHVLGHELVHQFQYDIAQRSERFQSFVRLPLFVIEGMAEYFSVGREDALTAMWMRDAVLRNDFPTIGELQRSGRYNEYQYGQPFWAYVAGEYGDEAGVRLFRTALDMPLDSALVTVTGLTPDSLSAGWEAALRTALVPPAEGREVPRAPRTPDELEAIARERQDRAEALASGRRPRPPRFLAYPDSLARLGATRLLARERDTGSMNLAPQLSPDGRTVAYLSEKDLFGIDLYLADAATGEVLTRLASVGTDAHTDALRFIDSAGAWRPDGDRFAFIVFAGGNNEIQIIDVETRRTVRRLAIEGIGAIKDLTYSPDGQQIAFSGVKGGITDLYAVDAESGTVRQLTNDRFADLQPSWSPDGTQIAFITDRGPGTDFDRLTFAPTRLALITLATGQIEPLSVFAGAKHINPVWSPDGQSLYFISDRGGFNDVYRLDVATRAAYQVTELATGVAGIADLSPALSVSRLTGDLAYSVFEGQRYSVYRTDAADAAGVPVGTQPLYTTAATLPPASARSRSRVEGYLADARGGLPPEDAQFASRDYRSKLSLDYISQPQVGAGFGQGFGGGVGVAGGVSFLFSDQLSDKALAVAVQANGTIQDIGAQALYLDRGGRFTYGGQVGHIPILQVFGGFSPDVAGEPRYQTRYFYRTFIDQAEGLLQYPLNQTQRFDLNAGYTRYSFDLEYDAFSIDQETQRVSYEGRRDVEGFSLNRPALSLGTAGVAFVGDYSNFGFTSPIRGGRYRFALDGTTGSLSFAQVTADYRRYLLLRPPGLPQRVPVTLAGRLTHFGRYGGGSDDSRLNPLFLGFGQFVRGYTAGSFPDDNFEYSQFQDRLVGTKLGIATVEARIPLLGVPQLGLLTFPYLPTELVFFADAGMVWGRYQFGNRITGDVVTDDANSLGRAFSDQTPVFSAGVSGRISLLGALVVEPYYAFPFSRYAVDGGLQAGRGIFGVNLFPGW